MPIGHLLPSPEGRQKAFVTRRQLQYDVSSFRPGIRMYVWSDLNPYHHPSTASSLLNCSRQPSGHMATIAFASLWLASKQLLGWSG